MYHEDQGGSDKRPQYQGSFRGSHSSLWFRGNGSQGRYPVCFLISIMANLTGSFMPLFISPMEDSLVLVIILARVVVSLQEVHFLIILSVVVILG